jgi:hypothetical protein
MPMSTGYSRTPLVRKLGIKQRTKFAILDAPVGYLDKLGTLSEDVILTRSLNGQPNVIQIFSKDKGDLEKKFLASKKVMKQNGAIWVSWPKRSSTVRTELSEHNVREIGLRNGLVDVKICSVDETWSGLKFVRRVRERK